MTPVEYSDAAVKILHMEQPSDSICFNLHWHDRIEIIRVKKGEMLLDGYMCNIKLMEGEMIVFTPKMSHKGYTEKEGVEYDVLMFDLKTFYNQTKVCDRFFSALLDGNARFENVISDYETLKCVDEICTNEDTGSLETVSLVYKLMHLLFKKHLTKLAPVPKTKIKQVIDYIEENYAQDISIATLSKRFNYSQEHLCRKFKEATGITPMIYLRIYRLEQAIEKIRNQDCGISEIASQCGFNDSNYFARCFKAHFGASPSRYKRK